MSLPVFGYSGYRAELDGQEIPWTLGENNRLTVQLPAGASGTLNVWFAGDMLWRTAEGVSLAALAAILFLAERKRRKVQ